MSETPTRERGGRGLAGRTVLVLGAGMVGVATALELQSRGADVTLLDRREPGRETSYGNAGVLARSSLIPLNNPGLALELPNLLGNRRASLRYDPGFVLRNPGWALRFLANGLAKTSYRQTVAALDGLIRLSIARHLEIITKCGLSTHLADYGWLHLFRSEAAFARGAQVRQMMRAHEVDMAELDAGALREMEPALNPIFPRALWIKGSYAIDDPGALVTGYARYFQRLGGRIEQAEAIAVEAEDGGAAIRSSQGLHRADRVVLCLGPWGRPFLERSGWRIQMAYERGYHRHYSGRAERFDNTQLVRPIYDAGGGYVLSPMRQGLRLSTGVELCDQAAPPDHRQLARAELSAREAIELGAAIEEEPWLGARPTFPDSRPAIGPLPGLPHVLIAFGHQHIGFSTGPGTAELIADMMEGVPSALDTEPFRPDRYIRRRN